jgi:chromate transporter
VGYKKKGILGGICATLGIVFPSLVIIIIIAAFISNFADLEIVKNAFAGIRVCVCVLVLNTVIKLWKSTIVSKTAIIIFSVVLILSAFTNLSNVIIVIGAGVAGMVISILARRGKE